MLEDAGYSKLVVAYEGSCDEGDIQSVIATNKDGVEEGVSPDIENKVKDYAFDILESKYPGWEINEGSFGEITISPCRRTITYVHNYRVESVETEEGRF
jgi:hypothetical protein